MTRVGLKGLNGSNPLGFMASIGLLRILDAVSSRPRLGFADDGTYRAWIEGDLSSAGIVDAIVKDASPAAQGHAWRLTYEKREKRGTKVVADLKAPPEQFAASMQHAVEEWVAGRPEACAYVAAYGTDVAVDGKGNTKPTAFHFTAANQQFLKAVEETRTRITTEWVAAALNDEAGKLRPGSNLRWDPDAERSRALMGANPNDDGTSVNAPLEWLAFRGLPAFVCLPIGSRVATTGVVGRRQDELRFFWALWAIGASHATATSLIRLAAEWGDAESNEPQSSRIRRASQERRARGVFALCASEIRRTSQGFGNFGPASVLV